MTAVARQEGCTTCGLAAARSAAKRLTGAEFTEAEMVAWSRAVGRGYIPDEAGRTGGTWPKGMEELLNQAGVETRVPFGGRFDAPGPRPVGDPAFEGHRFELSDATREIREGNQVMAVVDYASGTGQPASPHWVIVEQVGNGRVTRNGETVIDGPYVVIGDPATGKSVAIAESDFLKHWQPESTVIALNPKNGTGVPIAPRPAVPPPTATAVDNLRPPAGRLRDGSEFTQPPFMGQVEKVVDDGLLSVGKLSEVASLYDKILYGVVKKGLDLSSKKIKAMTDQLYGQYMRYLPESARKALGQRFTAARSTQSTYLGTDLNTLKHPSFDYPTTTPEMREYARLRQVRNPFPDGDTWLPPSREIAADHLFPADKIKGLRGFDDLDWDLQMEVMYNTRNIEPMDAGLNSAKGNRTADEWQSARIANRQEPLSDSYMNWLRAKQKEMEAVLLEQISCLRAGKAAHLCR